MHWIFLAIFALACVALAVLSVAILIWAFKAMLLVTVVSAVYFIWQRLFGRQA